MTNWIVSPDESVIVVLVVLFEVVIVELVMVEFFLLNWFLFCSEASKMVVSKTGASPFFGPKVSRPNVRATELPPIETAAAEFELANMSAMAWVEFEMLEVSVKVRSSFSKVDSRDKVVSELKCSSLCWKSRGGSP